MGVIASTGGKGGTGKSSFAIIVALQEAEKGKKVLLVDCDVECPNDYILLGIGKLENPLKKTYNYYPKIIDEKCRKRGLCVSRCSSGALFQPPGRPPVLNKDLCSSCGVCWTICPGKAIAREKVQNGEIFRDDIRENLTLVTGRSIPGVRETSPIVAETRAYANTLSPEFDLTIIDTAAGSHCSVISALEGVDKAYAVTEPTPLGAHDLDVILGVLDVLKTPSEIVLNRCDISSKALIAEIGRKHNVPITIEIPYSDKFARIYSRGTLLSHEARIVKLFKGLKNG